MEENFDIVLDNAIKRCEGLVIYDKAFNKGFNQIYPFATENISGYIDKFDLKDKSLLTVGSSGDQVINAILYGCKKISVRRMRQGDSELRQGEQRGDDRRSLQTVREGEDRFFHRGRRTAYQRTGSVGKPDPVVRVRYPLSLQWGVAGYQHQSRGVPGRGDQCAGQ